MNTVRSLHWLFLLLLVVPVISGSKCISSTADDSKNTKHESRIIVVLKGPFSTDESAEAKVDGQSIGIVTPTESKFVIVDSGKHTISVTSAKIPTNISSIINISTFQTHTFNFECDYASVTFKAEGTFAIENTKLMVYIDKIYSGVILPGQPLTLTKVAPGNDRKFEFYDDSKKLRSTAIMTIQYKSTNSIEIPYN